MLAAVYGVHHSGIATHRAGMGPAQWDRTVAHYREVLLGRHPNPFHAAHARARPAGPAADPLRRRGGAGLQQERLLQPAGAAAGGAGQGNPDVDATVYAHLAEYATSLDIGRGQASSFHRPGSAVGCGCDLLCLLLSARRT